MLSLPWEIIFMILEHLPPRSCVALALTTKSLFTVLFPTGRVPVLGYYPGQTPFDPSREFELSERDEFLLLLEKDDPTVAFCFDCRKLCAIDSGRGHLSCAKPAVYRWVYFFDSRPVWSRPSFSEGAFVPLDSVNYHPLAWVPRMPWPAVNFADARLTMNRHMYGEPYGFPLECLEYRYEFERFINLSTNVIGHHFPLSRHPQGRQYLTRHRQSTVLNSCAPDSDVFTQPWAFKHISEGQIIDNELYIARFHSIKGPPVEMRLFFDLVYNLDVPICKHQRCQISTFLPIAWRSCDECFTDFLISLRKDDLTEWNCEVATCHRLGSCRSPSDPIWRLANDMRTDLRYRKWRLQTPPHEVERLDRIVRISSFRGENPTDEELELAQKADREKPGGIEGCWAHVRERQRDWKKWEMRDNMLRPVEWDTRRRNSPTSARNAIRRRRGINTVNT